MRRFVFIEFVVKFVVVFVIKFEREQFVRRFVVYVRNGDGDDF